MDQLNKSQKTYILIVITMLLGKGIWTYVRLDDLLVQRASSSWGMMLGIGIFGYICLQLASKVGLPEIWEEHVTNVHRIYIPALIGAAFGMIQILMAVSQKMQVPMVAFPLSLPVYYSLGVLSELMLHFIPFVFIVWSIGSVILKNRWPITLFWGAAILLSLWEPVLQTVMMLKMGIITSLTAGIFPFILVFAANLIPLHFLRKYGLLAAIIWRLSDYIVWHIIWGGFFM